MMGLEAPGPGSLVFQIKLEFASQCSGTFASLLTAEPDSPRNCGQSEAPADDNQMADSTQTGNSRCMECSEKKDDPRTEHPGVGRVSQFRSGPTDRGIRETDSNSAPR